MITVHFRLQPQYKYELFHINFTCELLPDEFDSLNFSIVPGSASRITKSVRTTETLRNSLPVNRIVLLKYIYFKFRVLSWRMVVTWCCSSACTFFSGRLRETGRIFLKLKGARKWRRENPIITTKKIKNSHVNLLQGRIIKTLYEGSHDVNTVI